MTLVELLFSMGIMCIVTAGIFTLYMAYHAAYRFQESLSDIQQNGRISLSALDRELRWAGYGLFENESAGPPCHAWAGPRHFELIGQNAIRFLSNLHGVHTHLALQAGPGDTELAIPDNQMIRDQNVSVSPGSAFRRNDTVYIYSLSTTPDSGEGELDAKGFAGQAVDVECHKLVTDGRSGRILLSPDDPMRRSFPAGSLIHVVNELEYYLDPDRKRLMRRIDGGTGVLAEGIEDVSFIEMGDRIAVRIQLRKISRNTFNEILPLQTNITVRNQ